MSRPALRPASLPGLDALKALASQLIVLHHLAYYGPMADIAWPLAPDLLAWLANHARIAVQVFLVLSGFLAAHALAPDGQARIASLPAMLLRRYLRLALPFAGALLITLLCAAWARSQMNHALIPAVPGATQFALHVLMLHGVLGVESLSAGVWYVAIDLQLFALLAGLLWLGQRLAPRLPVGPVLALGLGLAALFHFNLDDAWDSWGLYFFGSYALGAGARWALAARPLRHGFALLAGLTLLALLLDYRARILVALLTALWLLLSLRRPGLLPAWVESRPLRFLGRISYAVFLIHFAVLLLVNPLVVRLAGDSPAWNALGVLAAWGLSVAAGAAFHRWVERPALAWAGRLADVGLQPAR